ncbi:uncharacterized protein FIBRA_04017 [Fibroporia radiculosa]|uniref:Uncharacterized protein n=1 Tax=Fibroporia radiculosa TaxID=599839 RepID=J4H2Q7_9APHY|nr:uncharacterized protein FIBRA_04017 [Fibroporia radiculosa]CCM01944.1 predicted protein [Fibroporia radiculosa]
MPPSLLWRRRTSTPFFPGAWPNSSSSVNNTIDESRIRDETPPQLPELLHIRPRTKLQDDDPSASYSTDAAERTWLFSTALETHPFEDTVVPNVDVDDVLSCSATHDTPLNASFSPYSNFTEPSDSEGVLTPDSLYREPCQWSAFQRDYSESNNNDVYPHFTIQDNAHFSSNVPTKHSIAMEPMPSRVSIYSPEALNMVGPTLHRSGAVFNPPSLDFMPPLTLSALSLDLNAIFYPSDANMDGDSSPIQMTSQSPSETTHISFALPSDATEHAELSPMASTFFPVPSGDLVNNAGSTNLSLCSRADSPVLPSRDASPLAIDFSLSPGSSRPWAPTSADLDAFAHAATVAAFSTHSSFSFSTSTRSDINVDCNRAQTNCRTSKEQVSAVESCEPSLALAISACASTTVDLDRKPKSDHHGANHERSNRRGSEDSLMDREGECIPLDEFSCPGTRLENLAQGHSMSPAIGAGSSAEIPVELSIDRRIPTKLPVMGKMKKFGGRILGIFTGGRTGSGKRTGRMSSPMATRERELGGIKTTTTTVTTNVEYRSKYPTSALESPVRNSHVWRRSLALPTLVSKSPSHLRTPKHFSFLSADYVDDNSVEPARLQSDRCIHPTTSIDEHYKAAGVMQRCFMRSRTQTAPPVQTHQEEGAERPGRQTRRFSLSSALSKSKLEVLRNTVVPHPPVPPFPHSSTIEPFDGLMEDKPVRPISMIAGYGQNIYARRGDGSIESFGYITSAAHTGSGSHRRLARPSSTHVGNSRDVWNTLSQFPEREALEESRRMRRPMSRPPIGKDQSTRQSRDEADGMRSTMREPSPRHNETLITEGHRVDATYLAKEDGAMLSSPSSALSNGPSSLGASPLSPKSAQSGTQVQGDRALRRFSLTSAISRRAMRARSMIVSVGRRSVELESRSSATGKIGTGRRTRGNTFSTVVDASGVHFDMLTPDVSSTMLAPVVPSNSIPSHSRGGEYGELHEEMGKRDLRSEMQETSGQPTPDSELDSMSFAYTATHQESLVSIVGRYLDMQPSSFEPVALNEGYDSTFDEESEDIVPFTNHMQPSPSFRIGLGTAAGVDENEQESVEREEDRGFLRALGLEFDDNSCNP